MLGVLVTLGLGLVIGPSASGKDLSARRVSDVPGTISSFAGQGDGATDGLSWAGMSIAADSSGNLYVAAGNVIRRVDASTGAVTVFAGDGNDGYSGDGGPATSAELSGASALAIDSAGDVFIADSGNAVIRKVDGSTGDITTIAGDGQFGFAGDGGPATSAEFDWVYGVAVDGDGNVYVDDSGNCEIREIAASDGTIRAFAGNGTCGFDGDGGPAANAEISAQVYSLAVDSSNDVYISDFGNDRIREVNGAEGAIDTVIGTGSPTWALGDGGPAVDAPLCCVSAIAVDPAGNLYVASWDAVVSKVDASDGQLHTVVGNWQNGDDGNGGPATDAEISNATAIAIGGGNMYFAQDNGNYLRKVSDIEDAPVVDDVWPHLEAGAGISLSGTPEVGSVVSIDGANWDGSPTPTIEHSWMRCDRDGANCASIDGANEATYTVTSDDEDHTLEGVEIATNEFGGNAPPNTNGTVSPPMVIGPDTSNEPTLSDSEQAEAISLATSDSRLSTILDGASYTVGPVAVWTKEGGGTTIGGVVRIDLDEPRDITADWPEYVYNTSEDTDPVYQTMVVNFSAPQVESLDVSVDLNCETVVGILPEHDDGGGSQDVVSGPTQPSGCGAEAAAARADAGDSKAWVHNVKIISEGNSAFYNYEFLTPDTEYPDGPINMIVWGGAIFTKTQAETAFAQPGGSRAYAYVTDDFADNPPSNSGYWDYDAGIRNRLSCHEDTHYRLWGRADGLPAPNDEWGYFYLGNAHEDRGDNPLALNPCGTTWFGHYERAESRTADAWSTEFGSDSVVPNHVPTLNAEGQTYPAKGYWDGDHWRGNDGLATKYQACFDNEGNPRGC